MKRFLCDREGSFNISDSGFLSDPDGEYGRYLNPGVTAFDNLLQCRCLVVLGEPGIGKSTELERIVETEKRRAKESGDEVLYFRLRNYDSGLFLCSEVFENEAIKRFELGAHSLYLFLDDLDEGLLSIKTLATLLSSRLEKLPSKRLYLRIACRTAEWPETFCKTLRGQWGDQEVKLMELVPLRRKDVAEFAENEAEDSNEFIHQIVEKEVVPLAIKPLTLKFLINLFRKHKTLPKTQAELYAEGCKLLCEEPDRNRFDSEKKAFLPAEQLLVVAERIAAVSIFANRAAIWRTPDFGNVPDSDITVSKLCGGYETASGISFQVTEALVRETLKTGLFTSRGADRSGWAHQTYAEFLAARYLQRHRMNTSQIMNLLANPEDEYRRIIPQLRETAAWLAGMDRGILSTISKYDPQVLLRSDIATADLQDRVTLVENLLCLLEEEKILDDDWDLYSRYKKLNHPGLADQLRPYINDTTKGALVRRVATDIVEACELKALQHDLAVVVLDSSQPRTVRINAAYAVACIGDPDVKAKLKPLVLIQREDDSDDELKGCGLKAIWPDVISAEELFPLLSYPQKPNFHGAYSAFLYNCSEHLRPLHLTTALEWVEKKGIRPKDHSPFSFLRNKIIELAWENLEEPSVLERLINLLVPCLDHPDDSTVEILNKDESKRRLVFEMLLLRLPELGYHLYKLTHSKAPLVRANDLPFLVSLLQKQKADEIKLSLVGLIEAAYDISNIIHTELVMNTYHSEPILASKFFHLILPVELGSAEAESQKAAYKQILEWNGQEDLPKISTEQQPSPIEKISELLVRFEDGNWDAWWHLNLLLSFRPDGYAINNSEADIKKFPGWQNANLEMQNRIVLAAKQYLLHGEPKTEKWLGKNIVYHPAYSGFRALLLLYHEDLAYLQKLPVSIWKKWAPIIIFYPVYTEEDSKLHLLKLLYKNAPEETGDYLLKLIDVENSFNGPPLCLGKLKYCWDEKLIALLEPKLYDESLKPRHLEHLLKNLLDHGSTEARRFAESVINKITTPQDEWAEIVARNLFLHTEDCGWQVLWPLIKQNIEFGRSLLMSIADTSHKPFNEIFDRFSEEKLDHLADLYIWLVQHFPYKDDPDHLEVYSVGHDDSVRRLRDSMLEYLKEKGSKQAVNAIRKIAETLPEIEWIKLTVLRAQAKMRRVAWNPCKPETIIALAYSPQKRLVQSGAQLLEVIIESLNRLTQKLHGETPAAADLWNQIGKDKFRPKEENHLSDYVKRHLEGDLKGRGIILNREVEIRRSPGAGLGERTDVRVDAVSNTNNENEFDKVSVIIEIKGCWNRNLDDAMHNQLKNRYLIEEGYNYGLYLVGWFSCSRWDSADSRKGSSPKVTIEVLTNQLREQADALSSGECLIKSYVLDATL